MKQIAKRVEALEKRSPAGRVLIIRPHEEIPADLAANDLLILRVFLPEGAQCRDGVMYDAEGRVIDESTYDRAGRYIGG